MVKNNRLIISFIIFLAVIFSPIPLHGQSEQFTLKREIPRDSLLLIANSIIDSAKCKVLITVDEMGKPQARAMSVFPPEENMVIWLGTSPQSRKVAQIRKNPNVMVYYYDTKGYSYVSLAGTAQLVDDPAKKKKYWKKSWTRFYPDPEKDYILIKVTPNRMEVCSFKHKLYWDKTGKPAFLEF